MSGESLSVTSSTPDKRLVAASFSRAAASYDDVAQLQRLVGQHLLEALPASCAPTTWVDLGCGTGHFSRALSQRFAQAKGLALDIAEGMLQYARRQHCAAYFVAADAEALPLADNSQDLIFSSLVLQWCGDFAQVLREAYRVLKPGGVLAFTSLGDGTLQELRESWRAVDQQVHVNCFRSLAQYQTLCRGSGFNVEHLRSQNEVVHFADVRALSRSLKDLGAQNLNAGRREGLSARQSLQTFSQAYEAYRQPEGLPATYQVIYGVLQKDVV